MRDLPGLSVLIAGNPSPMTLDGTRTFVVGDREKVVIDPGPDDPAHLQAIETAVGDANVRAILLTHIHPDHAAGAEQLAERLNVPIWRGRGADESWPEIRADHWFEADDEIVMDRGLLRPIHTPGHSPDHHVFWWTDAPAEVGDTVFVGDLLMGEGDTTLVAVPEGDLARYLDSLDRVSRLGAMRFFPAHGPEIRDPAEAVDRYRRHRELRIQQVARAGGTTADSSDLVRVIYGESLDPSLAAAAEASIRAILVYLRDHHEVAENIL